MRTSIITKNKNNLIYKNKSYENSISNNILNDYNSYYLNYELNNIFIKK